MAGMKFEEVYDETYEIMGETIQERMPELTNAKIKILFCLKKRSSGGKMVLGKMQKANNLIKHLTAHEVGEDEGYDYVMTLDKVAYDLMEREDKIRLIRHELRHCFVDNDSESNPYKVIGHDIEDFLEEIELNRDDTGWATRCAASAESEYRRLADQG